MKWTNYFNTLEKMYRIKIDSKLQDTIQHHFGTDLGLYTEQDMYEQSRKIIESYQFSKKHLK